ncbi:MAG TPA: hypothetical protein VFJ98_03310 [Mycobacteriales bacterium]|nr:hypothetical protein [Mycobacteriales bacterium]
MRRLFYIALGATAGVLVVRKVTAAANKWTPEGIAAQAGGAGERLAAWWAEVQHFAAEREIELRDALGLDAAGDADDGGVPR